MGGKQGRSSCRPSEDIARKMPWKPVGEFWVEKGVSFTWKSSSWPLQGGQWVKGPVQSLGGDGTHGQGRGLLKKSCRKDLLEGWLDWTCSPES